MRRRDADRHVSTAGSAGAARVARYGLAGLLLIPTGCDEQRLSRRHAALCRAEARTIVHDRAAWSAYLTRARARDRQDFRAADIVRIVQRLPPDFDARFEKERIGANEPLGEIVRNDVAITRNDAVIATLVNYDATIRSLGHIQTPSCTSIMPQAYVTRPSVVRPASR